MLARQTFLVLVATISQCVIPTRLGCEQSVHQSPQTIYGPLQSESKSSLGNRILSAFFFY
uniref:Uncharacterized protein n=1 Tax=Oryza punctata TaxID=4537 RepID=A0A0E0MHM3_ORYPU